MKVALGLSIVIATSAAGCVANPDVVRVYSGKVVEGPYITPEAYAHYTQGAIYEASGNDREAADEYAKAAEEDSESPDIWTRLGATHCRMKSPASETFFAHAEDLDRNYAPLWRERAGCALARSDAKNAREWSRLAVSLDPDDEASTVIYAQAEAKLAHKDIAKRWLEALIARDPTSERARIALANLDSPKPPAQRKLKSTRPTIADVDRALVEGGAAEAHALAVKAGVPLDTVAIRAAALGKFEVARAEAERALAADPGDADAWVAALVAADALGDRNRFATALAAFTGDPIVPSPLGARLLAELIERRVGKDAARAWLDGLGPLPEPADDLERRVATRSAAPTQ